MAREVTHDPPPTGSSVALQAEHESGGCDDGGGRAEAPQPLGFLRAADRQAPPDACPALAGTPAAGTRGAGLLLRLLLGRQPVGLHLLDHRVGRVLVRLACELSARVFLFAQALALRLLDALQMLLALAASLLNGLTGFLSYDDSSSGE